MTFTENNLRYQRKPVHVHALRLDEQGRIPDGASRSDHGEWWSWLDRLLAERRLQRGEQNWFVRRGTDYFAVAYAGDWIVLDDATDRVSVVNDETFRAQFEDIDADWEPDAYPDIPGEGK